MSTINLISEYVILNLSDLVNRQYISRYLRYLLKSQYWTENEITDYQNKRLKRLISHSVSSVPYYANLFNKLKLSSTDIQRKEDLHKIPLLTKSIIKNEDQNQFISKSTSFKNMIKSSSSGSTGEPLFYYTTNQAYSLNIAAGLRGWYWMGYRLGDRYIKLSQNPRKKLIKRIQDKLSKNLYLATNPLQDSNFEFILSEIERYKPKIIRCYPDPLLFLARYRNKNPKFIYKPNSITTTGNTLHPETREEIESAFGCKIFDAYSCEGNSTVFECPTHTCYHSTEEYGISEVVDDKGNPVTSGIGRLISTDLWNYAHPFIRYDTQDLVEVSSEPCICGRKLLRINRIIGRDNDILISRTGRKFIVHNFTGFFQTDWTEINKSIDQFQVIHKKDGSLLFKIVSNDNFNLKVEKFIVGYWEKEFDAPVTLEVVNNIPISASGKRKFIIIE